MSLAALTKILAKEVAPFNIRILTVVLGTFNTNMPNSVVLGKTPLPEDYKGTFTEQVQGLLVSGLGSKEFRNISAMLWTCLAL